MDPDDDTPQPVKSFQEYRNRYFPTETNREVEEAEAPGEFGARLAHETLAASRR